MVKKGSGQVHGIFRVEMNYLKYCNRRPDTKSCRFVHKMLHGSGHPREIERAVSNEDLG